MIVAILYPVVVLVILLLGFCLLLSPGRFFIFRDQLRLKRFRTTDHTLGKQSMIQWRIVGAALTVIALYMLIAPFAHATAILKTSLLGSSPIGTATSSIGWGSYAFLVGFFALGLALALRPNRTVNWLIPSARWGDSDEESRARVIRISGILIIIFAAFCIFLSIPR